MTQISYFWNGTVLGDAGYAPYDEDAFSQLFRLLFTHDPTVEGVISGYQNQLEVQCPTGTTLRVKSGAAICYGTFYENTADKDFALTPPGSNTDWYRMVVRKDWAAKTTLALYIGPNNAVGASYPALTWNPGTTYDIPLADFSITSGGAVSITSQRQYVRANGDKVPIAIQRRSDAGNAWHNPVFYSSHTAYRVGRTTHMQCGCVNWAGSATSGNVAVTFPKPYNYAPVVLIEPKGINMYLAYSAVPTTTGFTIYWADTYSTTLTSIDFMWVAFGPIVGGV